MYSLLLFRSCCVASPQLLVLTIFLRDRFDDSILFGVVSPELFFLAGTAVNRTTAMRPMKGVVHTSRATGLVDTSRVIGQRLSGGVSPFATSSIRFQIPGSSAQTFEPNCGKIPQLLNDTEGRQFIVGLRKSAINVHRLLILTSPQELIKSTLLPLPPVLTNHITLRTIPLPAFSEKLSLAEICINISRGLISFFFSLNWWNLQLHQNYSIIVNSRRNIFWSFEPDTLVNQYFRAKSIVIFEKLTVQRKFVIKFNLVHSPKDKRVDEESSSPAGFRSTSRIGKRTPSSSPEKAAPPLSSPPSQNTRSRKVLFSKLKRLSSWLVSEEVNNTLIETLELKLEDLTTKFRKWEIDQENRILQDQAHETEHEKEGESISNMYFNIAGQFKRAINERKDTATVSSPNSNPSESREHFVGNSAKLPDLCLPKFDGSFEKYRNFHDEFEAAVHSNKKLTNVTKLQYLKSCLTGDAHDLIKELDITNKNYDVGWKLLEDTFNNSRLILRRHCTLLLHLYKKKDSSRSLLEIVNAVRSQLRPLDSLADKEKPFNALLITIILELLSDEVVFQWENTLPDKEMPKVNHLLDFIQRRGLCVKSTEVGKTLNYKDSSSKFEAHGKNKKKKNPSSYANSSAATVSRPTGSTQVFHTSVQKPCTVCQGAHKIYGCPRFQEMSQQERLKLVFSQNRCLNCLGVGHVCSTSSRNHPLQAKSSLDPIDNQQGHLPKVSCNVSHLTQIFQKPVPCRMLLDTGSSSSFITTELAEKLQLPKVQCSISVGALNDLSTVANYRVTATVQSRHNNFRKDLDLLAIPAISSLIPGQQIDRKALQLTPDVRDHLADPEFHKPSPVQMLLSSGHSISTLAVGQRRIPHTRNLIAQNTPLNTMMLACEKHFTEHVSRTPEGRYMVALPFNNLKEHLGSSSSQAHRHFLALERKFRVNPDLLQEYRKVMEEYKQLGHMKKVTNEIEDGFYLPHHAVIKMSSMTTKVRVVFDGSAKSSSKHSLNDALMVGPTIQDDIFSLIVRFRVPGFVLTGDIEKMYRQVLVAPDDRKFQRIIWRDQPTDKDVTVYELQTVTFGLAPAPYLATRCLHQLADHENDNFPVASTILKRDLYVDDVLTGANSLEDTWQLRNELIALLRKGGFNLRQCASNSSAVLQGLPDSAVNLQLLGGDDPKLKALGVHWDSQQDDIVYTVNPFATEETITMRTIASDVARIFDPLGLLNPVITHAKIIQLELWRLKLDWDDSVPQEVSTRWEDLAAQLPLLNDLRFQRHIIIIHPKYVALHGFSDASEKAYGACLYLRSVDSDGNSKVHLWCAKSRITPLKSSQTIPRLELCAAELLTELYVTTKKATNINPDKEIFWTDSMITLQWINKSAHTLQTFVANREAKIQQRTNPDDWRHVRTYDNPADAISRGQLPTDFLENALWKHGPNWLTGGEETWPYTPIEVAAEVPDSKKTLCLTTSSKSKAPSPISTHSSTSSKIHIPDNPLLSYFSSFYKLRRFVALTLRWFNIYRLRKTAGPSHGQRGRGLIRVGGRLEKAKTINFDERHPIVLPPFHHITRLLIEASHFDNCHTGTQATLHLLRRKYWPMDGRRQIRHVINKCVTCCKFKPAPVNYIMGDLPAQRVTQSKPFEHTGVDYCGPLFIKEKKHRNRGRIKVWISLFVCFTTKAVHIEVVDDLSTEEFLAAFSRFLSRHPTCNSMYSDHGTNFVDAKNELKELDALLDQEGYKEKVQQHLVQHGIQWSFIPPRAPHCGGLWEAAVKSFKYHLRRVIGHQLLTHEQVNTLRIKIEGILNSRPLTPLSTDPNDLTVLTPAHFLHGSSTRDLPAPEFLHTPSNRLSYWEHLEKLKQEFWSRWHNEYLSELQIRHKWIDGDHRIKEGSLVLLREDNLPPMQWRMARILETYPASDNIIRKVKVKTTNGVVEKNVKKLCLLPID
ncbi:uncharacterized protein LOC135163930 [Diachasmimorpha longicaudata]|uniref:uncharacterized protein LOC135163930 n=1 Tax=Diachasmimorpha longicaudata TaxID=58733 RepID=UPI0030B8CA43